MHKYRDSKVIRAGFIGVVLIILVIAVGLRPQQLVSLATSVRYQVLFAEAGGLAVGNDVKVSGVKVGTVSDVALHKGKALVTVLVDATVHLGSETTAHIRTGSLLGARIMTLESAGPGTLSPSAVIPLSRTGSPYSLTEAVSDVTTDIGGTDTTTLDQSLDTLSATIDKIAPELGPAFDGLTRLSRAFNDRRDTLRDLLKNADDVTGILSQRSEQINTLILDGNDLLAVLVTRRQEITDLLANTAAVAHELSGVVADNEAELAPTLDRLNSVAAVLEKNRDNISKALPGLKRYEITSGETVSNGPYYTAYVPNLDFGELLQPFLDYVFGFRRGVDAGQPPDNAGPRPIFPFPYNGIPGPGEQWPR